LGLRLRTCFLRPDVLTELTSRSERQYKSRLKEWGLGRNIRKDEMEAIVQKRQKRRLIETDKNDLLFSVRNEMVPPEKIDRWVERNSVATDKLYFPPSDAGK
jgi:hypothetical protein